MNLLLIFAAKMIFGIVLFILLIISIAYFFRIKNVLSPRRRGIFVIVVFLAVVSMIFSVNYGISIRNKSNVEGTNNINKMQEKYSEEEYSKFVEITNDIELVFLYLFIFYSFKELANKNKKEESQVISKKTK